MKRVRTGRVFKTALLCLGLMFLQGSGREAYAAAPSYDNLPEGMTAERLTQLNDAVIEWDEIGDLVRYWNPTYVRIHDSAMQSVEEMQAGYRDFYDEMQDQLDEIDEGIDSIKEAQEQISAIPGTMVPMGGQMVPKSAAMAALEASLAEAKAGRKMIRAGIGTASRSVSKMDKSIEKNQQMRLLREQMTSVVQGLVISYHQLLLNRSMVQKQVELYSSLLGLQQNMQAQNLATAADVAAYQNRLLTAQQSLMQIDNGLSQLRKNIAIQCGYAQDADVIIAGLPAPDPHFLEGRDYAADRQTAINGNQQVIEADRLKNYLGYGTGLREMSVNEMMGKAGAQMDMLRSEVEKQQMLYEAAGISLQKAALTRDSAQRQYQLGMLGRSEYEGKQMEYISYEAAAGLAALNLQQAICNYQWALRGLMTIE